MYIPLYNSSIGLGGFKCKICGDVTKTESGMKQHLLGKHNEKAQGELFPETATPVPQQPTNTTAGLSAHNAGACTFPCEHCAAENPNYYTNNLPKVQG